MSDNLSFLLTCAAECLNNWGYNGHGKHVDDGVKEITRLRAENKNLRNALKPFAELAFHTGSMSDSDGVCVYVGDLRAAAAALKESGDE